MPRCCRIKIRGPPGGCWCNPARQAGDQRAPGSRPRVLMGGDEPGQDVGPPVHAVRIRGKTHGHDRLEVPVPPSQTPPHGLEYRACLAESNRSSDQVGASRCPWRARHRALRCDARPAHARRRRTAATDQSSSLTNKPMLFRDRLPRLPLSSSRAARLGRPPARRSRRIKTDGQWRCAKAMRHRMPRRCLSGAVPRSLQALQRKSRLSELWPGFSGPTA
jgi:hypothetical protein